MPQLQADQTPQRRAVIGGPGLVLVEDAGDDRRLEQAPAPDRRRAEQVARELTRLARARASGEAPPSLRPCCAPVPQWVLHVDKHVTLRIPAQSRCSRGFVPYGWTAR